MKLLESSGIENVCENGTKTGWIEKLLIIGTQEIIKAQFGPKRLDALNAKITDNMRQIGRLAMRHEGANWNAYYALPSSMEERIFLGSISMGAIANNPERKQAFMQMMREIVSDIIEAKTGVRPTWGEPTIAPEHERAGTA